MHREKVKVNPPVSAQCTAAQGKVAGSAQACKTRPRLHPRDVPARSRPGTNTGNWRKMHLYQHFLHPSRGPSLLSPSFPCSLQTLSSVSHRVTSPCSGQKTTASHSHMLSQIY